MLAQIGFYRSADEDGFDVQASYEWGDHLPVAGLDGTVTYRHFTDTTYEELLASTRLNLIQGDVTRPYICPSLPQGDPAQIVEGLRVTAGGGSGSL